MATIRLYTLLQLIKKAQISCCNTSGVDGINIAYLKHSQSNLTLL